ncbi:MAG TPA: S46 family peptidase [Steroidobacteraceae bacterium]|nr:S46 family peptidase [Steroidobacteraceae bacterium]
MPRNPIASLTLCAVSFASTAVDADEGMWTFDNFPSSRVQARYGFAPDQAWLDHVRNSAVRLTSGCSASVVTAEGLVLTNHHCVVACEQTMSSAEQDYVAQGFLTHARREERQCPGMQAEILREITDVTQQVQNAIAAGDPKDAIKSRDAATARIADEACQGDATSRCQVVSLYQGGQYKLYRYRKYSDVRLVFAPEFAISFFGGDPDNFNFPRYCLDSAFVRLYENGQPAQIPTHLKWRRSAPAAGEVVFVAGNPGSTSRLDIRSQLEMQRDWEIPIRQLVRSELRGRLIEYSHQGPEQRRTAGQGLFIVENSFKAFYGQERALLDPTFFAHLVAQQQELHSRVSGNPSLARQIGDPWRQIDAAIASYQQIFLAHDFLEARAGSISQLFQYARALVRAAAERSKPSAQRLRGYADSDLPLLEKQLLDAQPVYPDLERLALSLWLSRTREYLTVDNPYVRHLLGADSPQALAARLVSGTRLADPKVREALWHGGAAAVDASDDPLIRFVRATDADAREVRTRYEQEVEGPITQGQGKLARARFKVYGDSVYPDATFTLRLSYGAVEGWTYHGETVAPFTNFGGLYARATGSEPFKLPQRWLDAQSRIDPQTPLDVSTNNDIIGGNSGSPLIDRQGEVVGAIFDGNIHSLGGEFGFDPRLNRSIAVLTAAIGPALRNIYQLPALADELESN